MKTLNTMSGYFLLYFSKSFKKKKRNAFELYFIFNDLVVMHL